MATTMESVEIYPLNRQTLGDMLARRGSSEGELNGAAAKPGGRRAARWPFPGTVELWLPTPDGFERHQLATSHDLSVDGIGLRCDEKIEPGMELAIAIHEPEASFHGRAIVRHCTPDRRGGYVVGMEFLEA